MQLDQPQLPPASCCVAGHPDALGLPDHGGALTGALTGLLWGGLVRIFLLHHVTWSINSICHFFGSRRFDVEDQSTNVAWLALPPASARPGTTTTTRSRARPSTASSRGSARWTPAPGHLGAREARAWCGTSCASRPSASSRSSLPPWRRASPWPSARRIRGAGARLGARTATTRAPYESRGLRSAATVASATIPGSSRTDLADMTSLLLIPLDDTVVFPTMDVTLPVDTADEDRVLLVPRHEGEYASVGTIARSPSSSAFPAAPTARCSRASRAASPARRTPTTTGACASRSRSASTRCPSTGAPASSSASTAPRSRRSSSCAATTAASPPGSARSPSPAPWPTPPATPPT